MTTKAFYLSIVEHWALKTSQVLYSRYNCTYNCMRALGVSMCVCERENASRKGRRVWAPLYCVHVHYNRGMFLPFVMTVNITRLKAMDDILAYNHTYIHTLTYIHVSYMGHFPRKITQSFSDRLQLISITLCCKYLSKELIIRNFLLWSYAIKMISHRASSGVIYQPS